MALATATYLADPTAAKPSDKGSALGYIPDLTICYLFIALFSLSLAVHLAQTIRYRIWFMIATMILGVSVEVLGWVMRMKTAIRKNRTANIIQFTTLIIAPTPILAANFVTVGHIIQRLGEPYSRLKPRLYTIIFLTSDIIALFLQGIGAYLASSADTAKNSINQLKLGSNIVLAGIGFQLAVIVIFMLVSGEFLWRYKTKRPLAGMFSLGAAPGSVDIPTTTTTRTMKRVIIAVMMNSFSLFIRATYRTVELADGWGGKVMQTEWVFNLFDAGMIVLTVFALNFGHPGLIEWEEKRKAKVTSDHELQSR